VIFFYLFMLIETKTDQHSEPSSPASFGWLCVAVLLYWSIDSLLDQRPEWITYVLSCSVFFTTLLTTFTPGVFGPLNRAWHQLGLLMGKIVSPLVLGFIFFLILTPLALVLRVFGRDPLRLKKSSARSFWIQREPQDTAGDFFRLPY
jgi:hypothetical protein